MSKLIKGRRGVRIVRHVVLFCLVFGLAMQPLQAVLAAETLQVSGPSAPESVLVESLPASGIIDDSSSAGNSNDDGKVSSDVKVISEDSKDASTENNEAESDVTSDASMETPQQEPKKEQSVDSDEPPVPAEPTVQLPASTVKQRLPSADIASGALTYGYELAGPPGRSGVEPNLSLNYNSQQSEEGSLVGFGWGLSIPTIERKNVSGVDKLYATDNFVSSLDGDLTKVSSESGVLSFSPKVDNGNFLKYKFDTGAGGGGVWTIVDKLGNTFTLGADSNARLSNPANDSQVFTWYLNKFQDSRGNFVSYEYVKVDGQVYPSEVRYTGHGTEDGVFAIHFSLEDRPDRATSAKYGFLLSNTKRIASVEIKAFGVLTTRYNLFYQQQNVNGRSQLVKIERVGFDATAQNGISDSGFKFAYESIGATNLLTKIVQNTGGITKVSYKPSSQYVDDSGNLLNPRLPFAVQTVSKIEYDDRNGTVWDNEFQYAGGWFYYNGPFDRRFVGFEKVTRVDSAGNKLVTYYHQGNGNNLAYGESGDDWALAGKVYKSELRDSSDKLFSQVFSNWEFVRFNGGSGNGGGSGASSQRAFTKLSQSVSRTFDGNASHKDSAKGYWYDSDDGNLMTAVDFGEVVASDAGTFVDIGTDKVTSEFDYAEPVVGVDIVGLASSEVLTDQFGDKVKESRKYYDNLPFGQVGQGNLTKQEQWVSGTIYATTMWSYSLYGLPLSETDPRGKTTNYSYDVWNIYPVSETNALMQTTAYVYDYRFGLSTQTIDPNGAITKITFDGLGRTIKEEHTKPNQTDPSALFTKQEFSYELLVVNTEVVGQKVTTLTFFDSFDVVTARQHEAVLYSDGFDRPIQTRSLVESAQGNTAPRYVVQDTAYNNIATVQKTSLPYFGEGDSKTDFTTDQNLVTSLGYDAMSRVIATTNVLGVSSVVFDDWQTTTTDATGKVKILNYDARGQLISVEEHNGNAVYETEYEYSPAGNLTKIIDALGNERNFTYDGVGRRVLAEDLHAQADDTFGTWQYEYDLAGNLVKRIDANGKVIVFSYDGINRLASESVLGSPVAQKTYIYDTCQNGVGRLCGVNTGSVSEEYGYDWLGQIISETKTIDGQIFITGYAYDRQGGLIEIINPDSSSVKYEYNIAGQQDKVFRKEVGGGYIDVVANIDYAPTGAVSLQEYANGARTVNTYDSAKLYRLVNKTTTLPLQSGGVKTVQNLSYLYDAVGNIISLRDSSELSTHKNVIYAYDDLHRLVSVQTDLLNGQRPIVKTYQYDAIGNITASSDAGVYSYEGNQGQSYANPHAVTKIIAPSKSLLFKYDQNGNVIGTQDSSGINATLEWNSDNQLTALRRNGASREVFTYGYDSKGIRAVARSAGTISKYPSQFYNTDGQVAQKHILASGVNVATVKGIGASAELVLLHTDHLGSVRVSSLASSTAPSVDAGIMEVLDYDAFGSVRVDELPQGQTPEQRQYTGHEYDGGTGLVYAQARYYNPSIGRFLSQDPAFWQIQKGIPDPQLMNSYAYARNNPITYLDPNGEWPSLAQVSSFLNKAADFVNRLVDNGPAHGVGLYDIVNPATSFTKQVATVIDPNATKTDRVVSGVGVVAMVTPPSQKAEAVLPTASKIEWGGMWAQGKQLNPITNLKVHADDHAALLGIDSISSYYKSAKSFVSEAIDNGYQATINTKGNIIRIWDQATERFGSYEYSNGTLTPKTFFKSDAKDYFRTQQRTNPGQNKFDIKKLIK